MKTLHDTFAVINIIGCISGIIMMLKYYRDEVEFKDYEWLWNLAAFCCIAFCFFGALRELYSLLEGSSLSYVAWTFKFVTSGIYILTIIFYLLVKRYKGVDKKLNDNK